MILLADDDENDAFLLKRAATKAGITYPVLWVTDGEQAILHLNRCLNGTFPCPDLILLDVKMPRMTGFEVLTWIRRQSEFSQVPTVMLTTSILDTDRTTALELGASAFHTKPLALDDLVTLLKNIEKDWLRRC